MRKTIFICAQNVGRSQMAAALFNKYFPNNHTDSAGTNVETVDETLQQRAIYVDSAQHVIDILAEEGIDVSQNVRTLVTPEMLDGYDRIISMAEPDKTPSWLSSDPRFVYWEIEDPRGKSYEDVMATKELIKEKVLQLTHDKA